MNRRSFLETLAGFGVAGGLGTGDVTCGGGVPPQRGSIQAGKRLGNIGIQLYSVRRSLERDFEGTLTRLASIGYSEVEFAGYFDRRPEDVRRILQRTRLTAPSSQVPIEVMRRDWAQTLDTASKIGHRYVVVPYLAEEDQRTLDDFKRVAAEFNRLGAEASRAGLRFAYHNHDLEFRPMDGRLPYDVLLAETDPANVAFELDLMWISKGGQDPVSYFARYPGRFEMVHVKDSTGAPDHRHVDVGSGTIDFRRILSACRQAGIRHFFVEHDEPADELAFARASHSYLAELKLSEGPRE